MISAAKPAKARSQLIEPAPHGRAGSRYAQAIDEDAGALACPRVDLEQLLEVARWPGGDLVQAAVDHPRDPGERDAALQERSHSDLIGRVQDGRGGAADLARLASEAQAGKGRLVRRLEGELADIGEVEPRP